jgi:hypothetical protein
LLNYNQIAVRGRKITQNKSNPIVQLTPCPVRRDIPLCIALITIKIFKSGMKRPNIHQIDIFAIRRRTPKLKNGINANHAVISPRFFAIK